MYNYKSGDYFGEMGLIFGKGMAPPTKTPKIISGSEGCKCLVISHKAFIRMFGTLGEAGMAKIVI